MALSQFSPNHFGKIRLASNFNAGKHPHTKTRLASVITQTTIVDSSHVTSGLPLRTTGINRASQTRLTISVLKSVSATNPPLGCV